MKQAIIYARVSTVSQHTDRQVNDLTAYAEAQGYTILSTFAEQISGAKLNTERPALQQALSYAHDHQCIILTSELSRLGRNIDEVLKSVLFCKEHGINVYLLKEQFSIFNNEGKEHPFLMIFISVLGTCAELEREAIRYRMASGYANYRANGGKVGRKVGYRMTSDKYQKKYPQLYADLQEKHDKHLTCKRYTVRSLAEQYDVNTSTVQAISRIIAARDVA